MRAAVKSRRKSDITQGVEYEQRLSIAVFVKV